MKEHDTDNNQFQAKAIANQKGESSNGISLMPPALLFSVDSSVVQQKSVDRQGEDKELARNSNVMERTNKEYSEQTYSINKNISDKNTNTIPSNSPVQLIANDHFIVNIHNSDAIIFNSPNSNDRASSDFVRKNNSIVFKEGTDVKLIDSEGDYIKVSGEAFNLENIPIGNYIGWILKSNTNLKPSSSASGENLRIAQDLDDMLDNYILPALDDWEIAIRIQGDAYFRAYKNVNKVLKDANKDAEEAANRMGALLTIVCVGALGFLGDMAINSRSIGVLFNSMSGPLGSIEDALQTGIGETIDIAQGGWFTERINSETHPSRYMNNHLNNLVGLRRELREHIGDTKSIIGRQSTAINRANLLVEIYNWWNNARISGTPSSSNLDGNQMAIEFERQFWKNFILSDLVNIISDGRLTQASYLTLREPFINRFNNADLNISRLAGFSDGIPNDSRVRTRSVDRELESRVKPEHNIVQGSYLTQRLAHWASSYRGRTF